MTAISMIGSQSMRGGGGDRVSGIELACKRPYAHAFRCPAQRCHGAAAFTNTSLVPADRAGSRNARRNRPVAGECRVIGPVPNTGRTSPEIIVRPREGTKDRMALTVHIAIHTGITAM